MRIPFAFAISLLTILLAATPACRSTKKIGTAMSKVDTVSNRPPAPTPASDPKADSLRYIRFLYDRLQARKIDFKTFSAKVKVHYEASDGKNYEFNAFIRMEKNKVIWISVNALLGIEAFRAMITPDSVKVINKLDKVIQFRSVSYLQEISQLPFDFNTVQELILGNALFVDSSSIGFYRVNADGISVLSATDHFKNYLTLNAADLTIKHSKVDDMNQRRAGTCDLTYGDYERKDSLLFSTFRKITISEKSKLDIELAFKQYSFNETLNFPFAVPKNYKRK